MNRESRNGTFHKAMIPGFLGVSIGAVMRWSVEWGTWTSLMVFAYVRSGTKTAGLLAALMLLVAAFATPFMSRFFERYEPVHAARNFFALLTAALAATSFAAATDGPDVLIWTGGCLTACLFSPATPILVNVLPSLARDAEGLAAQTAVVGWAESAGIVLGSTLGALALQQSTSALVGIAVMFGVGAVMILITTLVFAQIMQRTSDVQTPATTRDANVPAAAHPSSWSLLSPPVIRSLFTLALGAALVTGALDVLYLPLADVSGLREARAGLFTAAYGVGGLLSVLVSRRLVGRAPLAPSLAVLGILGSIPIAALAVSQHRAIACLALVMLSGTARTLDNVVRQLLLQRCAAPGSLLRVMGLFQAGTTLSYAAGSLIPWAAGTTGVACIATAAIVPCAIGLVAKNLRGIDASADVPVTEIALLSTVRVMRSLQPVAIEALARRCDLQSYTSGDQIVNEGADGHHVFVLVDGHVDVVRNHKVVATLSRGDFFGELAVIRNQPRNATVTAQKLVTVLAIDGQDFADFVGVHTDVHSALESVMSERE